MMRKPLLILALFMLILSACATQTQPPESLTPEGTDQSTTGSKGTAGENQETPMDAVSWDHGPETAIITVTNCCGFVPDIVRINYLPEAIVWGDGRIVWYSSDDQGRRHVMQGHLSEDEVADLLTRAEEAGFFGWEERYADPMGPTDMPEKCVTIALSDKSHKVCEYWQGAPEAFHALYDQVSQGGGAQGEPFIPETGYLTSREIPAQNVQGVEGVAEWDASVSGMNLAEVEDGKWIEGNALRRAWDMVNAGPFGALLKDGDQYYQLTLQIPGMSLETPPAQP